MNNRVCVGKPPSEDKFLTLKGKKIIHSAVGVAHPTLHENHRYTFGIILRNTKQVRKHLKNRRIPVDLKEAVTLAHEKCIRRLVNAGLGVVLLQDQKQPCILIDPFKTRELLLQEFERQQDELAIKTGRAANRLGSAVMNDFKTVTFTPALELQLTHNIIQNAFKDYDKDEWIEEDGVVSIENVLQEQFPLHNKEFNRKFFSEYRKNTFDFSMAKATTGNAERWAIEELRLHFGERVAFSFAFMHIYNKALMPLTLSCILYYVIFRFLPGYVWQEYMQGLSIVGFSVAAFWGPSLLLIWERETNSLVEKWNLRPYQNTVFERDDENPKFKYVWTRNDLTGEMEKTPATNNHRLIRNSMAIFVLLSAIFQCVCLLPFIQWYVYAKQAPVCSACEEDATSVYTCIQFLTCFNSASSTVGTDRWVYILFQGILLGLTIDIFLWGIFNTLSEKFVELENYASRTEFENRLVHRRFVFVWSNWFFWFLFLAFVYLPFGDHVNDVFRAIGLPWFSTFKWEPSLLTLDTLFVTPLVVTQFLNLLLETVVPYLYRKSRGRTGICWSIRSMCSRRRDTSDLELETDENTVDIDGLARRVSEQLVYHIPVMEQGDDSNQCTAHDLKEESKLQIFDPMNDYLDACIQFSYVVMFTIVWPLLPFPAFFNNLLEVRGDAFRLLFAQRRPMPRRDVSIGEWATVLRYASFIGVIVVSGLVYMYHLGFWKYDCTSSFGQASFVPFSSFPTSTECPRVEFSYTQELIALLLLEHFGLFCRYIVLQGEKSPASIRSASYKRLKQIQEIRATKSGHAELFLGIHDMRVVFDRHDIDQESRLGEEDLIAFLAEWFEKPIDLLAQRSNMIFKYMDKNNIGRIPFSSCALLLQHVAYDRFLSRLLGLMDPGDTHRAEMLRVSEDVIEFQSQAK